MSDSNSWSIPKKSQPSDQQQHRPSMESAIPRKPSNKPAGEEASSTMMQNSIPRKTTSGGGASMAGAIPRKHKRSSSSPTIASKPRKSSRDKTPSYILSEDPFRIKIDLRGVIRRNDGMSPSMSRASSRAPSRDRRHYNELEDTDSEEDFLMDSSDEDDHDYGKSTKKKSSTVKKLKIKKSSDTVPAQARQVQSSSSVSSISKAQFIVGPSLDNIDVVPATAFLDLGNTSVESPPTGALSTLWYSREVFVNVYVIEKILAWKTRHVTQLEWDPASYDETNKPEFRPVIDSAEAAKYSIKALSNPLVWRDPQTRMEVSRLNHQQCPIVMAMAAEAQAKAPQADKQPAMEPAIKQEPSSETLPGDSDLIMKDTDGVFDVRKVESTTIPSEACPSNDVVKSEAGQEAAMQIDFTHPTYRIQRPPPEQEPEREEVFLVKWRGKSHLHVSWERDADIIRFDQSKSTARSKIQKFVQSQELAFGPNWKQVLEEERSGTPAVHPHGESDAAAEEVASNAGDDELYPPAFTEVERIMACDESEMDISLFAKQRALNILDEREREQQKDKGEVKKWNSNETLDDLLIDIPWDPEDNVRYVVKWKGQPYAEMTWEYWRDIKCDAVDEAEDFWARQNPPDDETIALSSRPHPHMKQFQKIQESPVFGLSERKRRVAEVVNGVAVPIEEQEEPEGFRLRSYQLEGVNWLLFNWWNKRSCILADEMGLGKTIQSVGFLKMLQDLPATKIRGPFLIVAPLSLVGQWQSESKTWAPDLNVVLYHGRADARDFLIKQDFFFTDQFVPKARAKKLRKQHTTKFHILITTYEIVMKDIDIFQKIKWRGLIVDEAHRLKNPKAKLFEDLSSVPRDHCILLTGTPLANATEELWALLHFADPVTFASKEDFLEKFGQLTDASQVGELHSVLKPYLLRRVKEDVEKSLPPKEETILEVTLTPIQKQFYKAIYERNTSFLFKGAKPSNSPSLMNVMMELRKCCNHPFLIRGAEERILADATEQAKSVKLEGQELHVDHVQIFSDRLVKSSGKMVLINKLLPKLYANGHKVLIFSQMVRCLDLLEEFLKLNRYKYERLDGSTSSSSRAAAVDRFIRKACQRFVMLLSTRAGGLGLNLTAADVVIIFDSDWNPQNDLQAMARAHRIGQTKAVRVYRLLTAKTYEMHMFHSASMKLGLERAVLSQQRDQGNESGEGGKSKSKREKLAQAKEIDELLKKGAYDIFKDDNDEEANKFMETDIDQLMESSAKTVTYGKQQSNLSSGLGSFSKASFVTDTGDGEKDVDLDDPDFWSKAVGLDKPVEVPEEISQMLDDGVKRSRKQVQQYDPYAEWVEQEDRKQAELDRKLQEEKEEKARIKAEKKRLKEKKRKEMDDKKLDNEAVDETSSIKRQKLENSKSVAPSTCIPATLSLKKSSYRQRALLRAEQQNPPIENLKQAWDASYRNKAISAILRFGFGRFAKVRHESGLQSLPLQDIEIFCRSIMFQHSLQTAVLFMSQMEQVGQKYLDSNANGFLIECLGRPDDQELHFLSGCLREGLKYYLEVEKQRRFLRLPMTLLDPSFVSDLRKGQALRSLRRLHLLSRLGEVISDCLDEIINELGYEQLAQRGCQTSNIASLGLDLKARLVTMEELTLALSSRVSSIEHTPPAAWWDRTCDLALVVGTFLHGFGNYDPMLRDAQLPFAFKMRQYIKTDRLSVDAQKRFQSATDAAKDVFDAALEASKVKAQKEVQKAVAAAAAASQKRERDAALLREGGTAAEAVVDSINEQRVDNLYEIKEGEDAHFITLPRMRNALVSSSLQISMPTAEFLSHREPDLQGTSEESKVTKRLSTRLSSHSKLLMPDARILNFRLNCLLAGMDNQSHKHEVSESVKHAFVTPKYWPTSDVIATNFDMRNAFIPKHLGEAASHVASQVIEYAGIGMGGSQCGTSHRSLDDRADFSISPATPDLYQIAYGSDSARYLRALGVPMTFGRFALVALINAEERCVKAMLKNETQKYFGDETASGDEKEKDQESSTSVVNGNAPSTNAQSSFEFVNGSGPFVKAENGDEGKHNKDFKEEAEDSTSSESKIRKHPHAGLMDLNVPQSLQANAALRSSVCLLLAFYGNPSIEFTKSHVCRDLWKLMSKDISSIENGATLPALFGTSYFELLLVKQCNGDMVPLKDEVFSYIENCLLPHCLKLCLYGNGPSTRDARGSKGKYDTFDGTNRYVEASEKLHSPLPDPCLAPKEHSIEAVGFACAILRRHRLMRCITSIAGGGIPAQLLRETAKSPIMRQSMHGLPVWWCPWIHDIALLVQASTRGLFSVFEDRKNMDTVAGMVFSSKAIIHHIQTTILPGEQVCKGASTEEMMAWARKCAEEFPSANVLERRLAFMCAITTEKLEGDFRYHNFPMFDHGAWPRN